MNNVDQDSQGHLYVLSPRGYSAYEIAVQQGFVGTEDEWLASLVGPEGPDGKSAYEVAVDNGYQGTEEEWVESFLNADGYYDKDEVDDKLDVKPYYFDTVADMKTASNLKTGDMVITLGYHISNDGGGAKYYIVSETTKYYETLDNNLKAEIINDDGLYNVMQYGCKNDGSADCSVIVQNLIDTINEQNTIYFPTGKYLFNQSLDLTNGNRISFKGNHIFTYSAQATSNLWFNGVDGFTNCFYNNFDNLVISGTGRVGTGITGRRLNVTRCSITYFNKGIDGRGFFQNNHIGMNNYGMTSLVDSRVIDNTLNANKQTAILLTAGDNDNIITNNKIEWNEVHGISLYQCSNNIISNNLIDRNTEYGIRCVQVTHSIINGNLLRRNYVSEVQSNSNAQIRFDENDYVTLSNNVTRTGNSKDDNTGFITPYCSIYITKNTNCILLGNDFSGGTKSDPVSFYQQDQNEIFYINDSTSLNDRIFKDKKSILIDGTNINSSGTTSISMNINTLQRYKYQNYYFEIFYRNGSNNDYRSVMLKAQVYKKSADSDHTMLVTLDTSSLGDLGIAATVNYDSDGDQHSLMLTFTNNSISDTLKVTCSIFNFI